MLTPEHLAYLTETRGLDAEILDRYGVKSVANSPLGDAIAFPNLVNGAVVNHKYRTLTKGFAQDKGGMQVFWNHDCLADRTLDDQPLIITEGELDALAFIQAGFLRVVSVPCGAPAQEISSPDSAKYEFLRHAEKLLHGVAPIILATDNDGPGQNLMNDLAGRLKRARCKFVTYPRVGSDPTLKMRCKDALEVLNRYGAKGVQAVVEKAAWLDKEGVYAMDELAPAEERVTHEIGMAGLDDHWKIRRKDFIVITGLPSHGKSSFINDLACQMFVNNGWRTAFASFEQEPQTDHKRNLRTWFLQKWVKYAKPEELAQADKQINHAFRFIVPGDEDLPNLEWMLTKIGQAVMQHNCDLIVIDPWNEMDHSRDKSMSQTEYVGFAIRQLKHIAKALNIAIIVAAHPAKMMANEGCPGLYHISDSAHFANKCDIGIAVYRPDKAVNVTEVHVLKVKYRGVNGKEGIIKYRFDDQANRYQYAPELN